MKAHNAFPKCILLPVFAIAVFWPTPGFSEQPDKGESFTGKIHYELRGDSDAGGKTIWLWSKEDKSDAAELCETPGWGYLEIHFSPNDKWIVVQDGGASLGVSLRLFRRDGGVVFHEIKDADIDRKSEKLALKQAGMAPKEISDHRYVHCLAWSGDSEMILVSSSGKGIADDYAIGFLWIGIYHVTDGRFTSDLTKFNREAVEKVKRQ
jgi:WD40 repeat protein